MIFLVENKCFFEEKFIKHRLKKCILDGMAKIRCQNAPRCLQDAPKTLPRRLQDAPRRNLGANLGLCWPPFSAKTAPRWSPEARGSAQDAARSEEKTGTKSSWPPRAVKSVSWSRLGLILGGFWEVFGRFLGGFWSNVGRFFGRFVVDFLIIFSVDF